MWKWIKNIARPRGRSSGGDEEGPQAGAAEGGGAAPYLKAGAAVAAAAFAAGIGLYCYVWGPIIRADDLPVVGGADRKAVRLQKWSNTWTHGARDSARVLAAGYRLSRSLLRSDRPAEALEIACSLCNSSSPGRELWKESLCITLAAARRTRKDRLFIESAYTLLANAGRYDDDRISERVLYRLCMTRLNRWLQDSSRLDVKPTTFGKLTFPLPSIGESDIGGPSRTFDGDPAVVEQRSRGVAVRSDG